MVAKENNKKPTMAFVDTSIHKDTKSGDFLRELFGPHFEITNYWDDPWVTEENITPEVINRYDYVFYEQTLSSFDDLKKVTAKIIWAPMYDGVDFNFSFWKNLSYLNIKAICFSRNMYDICQKYKIDSTYIQYYLGPEKFKINTPVAGSHVFFWHRAGLTFRSLKDIIDPNQIDSLRLRSFPDPGIVREEISEDDVKKYKIEILANTFVTKNDYLQYLSTSNIFVAPRMREGIGMSFIEALAMGQCVVAHNDSTMNEYITNNEDGYLFDTNSPQIIDFSNLRSVIQKSQARALAGYSKWKDHKELLIKYMLEPTKQKIRPPYLERKLIEIYYRIHTRKRIVKRSLYRSFYNVTKRRLVIIKLHGGLGNQLFQYAMIRATTSQSGKRFKLDTTFYKNSNRHYRLGNFRVQGDVASMADIAIKKFFKKILGSKEQYLEDYYQSEKYFKETEETIKKEFTLRDPLCKTAEIFANKIGAVNSVALHIRRGDYTTNDKLKDVLRALPLRYYEKAVEMIGVKVESPYFFVFSDDIDWAKENLKTTYPTTFVSHKNIEDYEELSLMSLCKHNIIANSSFSWWGAWLNKNPNKVVIAPKDWFVDTSRNTKDLIPETWIKI